MWRTGSPGRGWRWSCPVGLKMGLSGGCSPGAAEHRLLEMRNTEREEQRKFADISESWLYLKHLCPLCS